MLSESIGLWDSVSGRMLHAYRQYLKIVTNHHDVALLFDYTVKLYGYKPFRIFRESAVSVAVISSN